MKLETETSAFKTIEAWKSQAAQIGLVLRSQDSDHGDFPNKPYSSLRQIRRLNAIGKEFKKVVKTINRALITEREKGKPVRKEYLWYTGEFQTVSHKGEPFSTWFEVGRYQRPKIVPNGRQTYDQRTGEPKGPEKTLAGQDTIYEIEVPKGKEARRKLIESIIGNDNHPDNVLSYVRHLTQDNYEASRDESFSYDEFCDLEIKDLIDRSQRGSGPRVRLIIPTKMGL